MDPRLTHADLHAQARQRAQELRAQAIDAGWSWLWRQLTRPWQRSHLQEATCHS